MPSFYFKMIFSLIVSIKYGILFPMNTLPRDTKIKLIAMLVEGMSMRAISRTLDISINTVRSWLIQGGIVARAYHDHHVHNVTAKRIQADEIWSFVYAKQKNVARATAAPDKAGDVWTWTAIDADTKLIVSYLVGGRDGGYAAEFMQDVANRLAHPVQLTTDGHRAYLDAVDYAFATEIDYAQLIKLYGKPVDGDRRYSPSECLGTVTNTISGEPDPEHISTSYVERQNLSMRMGMRRFTRLTNGFSKKVENHRHMVALYFLHYNFCRMHKTLRMTPAMAAGIDSTLHDVEWIVDLIEARQPKPGLRGPYKKRGREECLQAPYQD